MALKRYPRPQIPTRLRVCRAELDISQRAVAARLGCDSVRFFRIEHGLQEPTPAELKILCKLFGKTVPEMFPAAREVTLPPVWDLRAAAKEAKAS